MAEALSALGSALLLLATLVWIVDIVGRQTIGYSVIGLNDITQLFVMAFISLALPITFLREGNITVEFVVDRIPLRARLLMRALVAVLTALFIGALAYFSWRQAFAQFSEAARSATLAIPMVYYWLPLLAGISLAALFCVVLALRDSAALFRP